MSNTLRKVLAMLLALAMLMTCAVVFAGCGDDTTPDNPDVQGDENDNNGDETPDDSAESLGYFAGVAGKDYSDEGSYTYLDYIGGTTGLNWNPHQWETNDDSYVLGYLNTALYDFVLNEDASGYSIIPEAAAEMPVDVTADYVGQYGIVEGETAKAWKIALNPDVAWSDGTPINADTYVYSMQQLLDPLALNRRADSFYAGDFEVVNAKGYLYSGKTTYEDNSAAGKFTMADIVKGDDGVYTTADGTTIYITVTTASSWCGGNSLADYYNAYGEAYFGVDTWDALNALADARGYIPVTDESLDLLAGVTTTNSAWGETRDDMHNYMVYEVTYPVVSWDEVGLFKTGDYEIVIVLAKPVAEAEFYMPYNLSSTWLVKEDVYEANKTWFDAAGNIVEAGSPDAASVTNTYCTSVETSACFGPYDLTFYQEDKQLTFTRNENWFGYSDGKHVGQYQTDSISCQVIAEHATALQAFLNGEVDGIGMDSEDLEIYASSDRLLYTPESYTTKLTFNTNKSKLEEIGNGAVVLTIPEFREAFSLAIDREKFCTEYTASHEPGYGLLNYMYCYDPFTGELYRDSEYAKKALVDLYELEYGEGKEYGDLDEAYDAITGYNLEKAKELMKSAADKAIADGLWDGASTVKLDFRVYSSDEIYIKMFNFFNDSLKAACAGSAFEGKIELTMTEDADYYETMYSGNACIIFSTWGGAAMSPFTMLYQCYCDAADGSGNQMEYGYETGAVMVELTVAGNTLTDSLQDWALWCNGNDVEEITSVLGNFADYTYDERCEVFAALEYTYLDSFVTTPVYYRNSASLLSRKLEYATTDYLQIVGYGGLRYATYNYTDEEWDSVKGSISY